MISAREKILDAAMCLARTRGVANIRRDKIAEVCGIATGTVTYHYNAMDKLRDAVFARAIERKDYIIIAQGLTMRHPRVLKASVTLRRKAAQCLV